MPTPKQKKTRSRRDNRRAHWRQLDLAANSLCPQCRKPKLPHRVCPHCGTYKGRDVLEFE